MTGEAFARPAGDVLTEQKVEAESGLTSREARKRLSRHGPNLLREAKRKSTWSILADQFRSLIVAFLFAALLVAVAAGDHLEALAIAVVIVINAAIGFSSELQAVRSMEALRRMGQVPATVRRGGRAGVVPARELVPGDIVLVEGGDVVSADLRIVESSKLQADEAALTGESLPVDKNAEVLPQDTPLAERANMLHKGSAVTRGSGTGVVVATGMATEIGNITSLVDETFDTGTTPLEDRLHQLGRSLIGITLGITVFVAAVGILSGRDVVLVLKTAIALAVAAVPEGLPIVATLALARGMFRLARRDALVNRLAAVETLGATNVICTDKTGTLTEGRMTLGRIVTAEGALTVTGGPSTAEGWFERDGEKVDPEGASRALLEAGVLCNNAEWTTAKSGRGRAVGDPLEVALLVAAAKAGIDRADLVASYPEEREVAFDPDVKMMATYHREGESLRVAVKGAPEAVLAACTRIRTKDGEGSLSDASEWERRNDELAEEGLRVIALAEKRVPDGDEEPYRNLCFLGFAGLVDPPRKDVRKAIGSCLSAGIRVVMLTGDQVPTARYIGREVGLIEDADAPVVEGRELAPPGEMSDPQRRRVLETKTFARVTPAQKLDLVRLYQDEGLVVAMTGDGVNDAPALKQADIGIAMGLRGTQVAREAADMVLRDDAFSSIVAAVRQGRIIFGNIRAFIRYLLSCNLSEILVVVLASLAAAPLPILPLQILFLNLVTDVFPALALGFGRGYPGVMSEPPRDPSEPILTRSHWLGIGAYGLLLSVAVLGAFAIALMRLGASDEVAVTISFLTLAMSQLWHVFNMRAPGSGLVKNGVTTNPWVWGALVLCMGLLLAAVYVPGLHDVLETRDPGRRGWLLATAMSLVPWVVGQIVLASRGASRDHPPLEQG